MLRSLARYLVRVLVALDQLTNTILGGAVDETISSRVGKAAMAGKPWGLAAERVINALIFWQPDHCRSVVEWDEGD